MHIVGLTGGIGSGKSLVAKIFIHLGIAVFNADKESGRILDEDMQVRMQLMEWFGPDIYINGKPDRPKIAGIIFNNPVMLTRMNALIHPRVMDSFIKWSTINQDQSYVIHEAAILFETGLYKQMNASILVTAPENIRIGRVMARDNANEESVRQRMQNQWPDEQKAALADYILLNDGITPLIPGVLNIHKKLIE